LAGTEKFFKNWISYEDAKKIIHPLNYKSGIEFQKKYHKRNDANSLIPKSPEAAYKRLGKWKGIDDFLGCNKLRKNWLPYSKARKIIKELKYKSANEFKMKYHKRNDANHLIPRAPDSVYGPRGPRKTWKGWIDFLGLKMTPKGSRNIFKTYIDAKKFTRSLGILSSTQWIKYCKSGKKPKDIPSAPYKIYKSKGWISWPDFLGTNKG